MLSFQWAFTDGTRLVLPPGTRRFCSVLFILRNQFGNICDLRNILPQAWLDASLLGRTHRECETTPDNRSVVTTDGKE